MVIEKSFLLDIFYPNKFEPDKISRYLRMQASKPEIKTADTQQITLPLKKCIKHLIPST